MSGHLMRQFCAKHRRGRTERRGVAAAEFALCLPLLVTICLGSLEICNLIYVRTRMNSVAYEGARSATRPGTAASSAPTTTSVTNRCNTLLTQLGVQGSSVSIQVLDHTTMQSKSLTSAVPEDLVTVSISAPMSQNCVTRLIVSGTSSLTAQATLAVE